MRPSLTRLTLRGFKTIRELKDFEPGRITLLIGPNGAGKSNLLAFFRMLSRALTSPGELQRHVGELGGASALLHDGPQVTREIQAVLIGQTESGGAEYDFTLSHAAGDTVIFAQEGFSYRNGCIAICPIDDLSLTYSYMNSKLCSSLSLNGLKLYFREGQHRFGGSRRSATNPKVRSTSIIGRTGLLRRE
jgi:energy-coupling factor transporter ATP-binding protein EcfA2